VASNDTANTSNFVTIGHLVQTLKWRTETQKDAERHTHSVMISLVYSLSVGNESKVKRIGQAHETIFVQKVKYERPNYRHIQAKFISFILCNFCVWCRTTVYRDNLYNTLLNNENKSDKRVSIKLLWSYNTTTSFDLDRSPSGGFKR
jgi:hypothetical protein